MSSDCSVHLDLVFRAVESDILSVWDECMVIHKSLSSRNGQQQMVFQV